MIKSTVFCSLIVLAGWANAGVSAAADKEVAQKTSTASNPDNKGGTCHTPKECCIQAGGWWHNGYCL
jgi:hypothetical protein